MQQQARPMGVVLFGEGGLGTSALPERILQQVNDLAKLA
jgi:hypothetical protein